MQMSQSRFHNLHSRYKHPLMKTLKLSKRNVDIISENFFKGKEDFMAMHRLMKKLAKGNQHLA